MASGEVVRLRLFGGMSAERAGAPFPLPSQTAARRLLAYLCVRPETPHPRVRIVDALWPTRTEAHGRRALSHALWQIRQRCPGWIEAVDDGLSCRLHDAGLWIDVDALQDTWLPHLSSAVSEQAHEAIEALSQGSELYRGPLLDGFDDDWILPLRASWEERASQAYLRLATLYKQLEHYEKALHWFQRLIAQEPFQPEWHKEELRLYARLGQWEQAQKAHERWCFAAEGEGISATEELRGFARGLLEQGREADGYVPPRLSTGAPLLTGGSRLPLIGRSGAYQHLAQQLSAACQGQGQLVCVGGEVGIGKTRLVQELLQEAEWRQLQVLVGQAHAFSMYAPYCSLAEALGGVLSPLRVEQLSLLVDEALLRAALPILPELGEWGPQLTAHRPLEPEEERQRSLEALVQILLAMCTSPLLLVLEDVHWADEATLALVSQLLPRLAEAPLLLVLTFREVEAREREVVQQTLTSLSGVQHSSRLHLERLSRAQSELLSCRCLGRMDVAPEIHSRLFEETQGHPLSVVETLRGWLELGALEQDDERRWCLQPSALPSHSEGLLPSRLQHTLRARLAQLTAQERELLSWVAMLGEGATPGVLQQLFEAEPRALMGHLARLVQGGLLREGAQTYTLSHEQWRATLDGQLLPTQRAQRHRRLAQLLAQRDARPAILAYHWSRAEAWSEAVEACSQAALEARRIYDNEGVIAHCRQGLALLDKARALPVARREALHFSFASHLHQAHAHRGEGAEAQEVLTALLAAATSRGDPEQLCEAHGLAARFFALAPDRLDEARAAGMRALELAQEHQLPLSSLQALEGLAQVSHIGGDQAQSLAYLKRALQLCEAQRGLTHQASLLHIRLAKAYYYLAQLQEAKVHAGKAMELAQTLDDLYLQVKSAQAAGIVAWMEGDWPRFVQTGGAHARLAGRLGMKREQAIGLSNLGIAQWSLGRYGDALLSLQRGKDIYQSLGDLRGMALSNCNLAPVLREIGSHQEALALCDEGLALSQQIDYPYSEGLLLWAKARIQLDLGGLEEAEQLCQRALVWAEEVDAPYERAGVALVVGQTRLAQGQLAEARAALEAARRQFLDADSAGFAAAAQSYLARCLWSLGEKQQAAEHSHEAYALCRKEYGGEEVPQVYLHHFQILCESRRFVEAQEVVIHAHQRLTTFAASLATEEQTARFWSEVPAHRSLDEAYLTRHSLRLPGQIHVRFPSISAPLGRPLRDDEWVDVYWHPVEPAQGSRPAQRQARLLQLAEAARAQAAAPTVEGLAAALDVHPRTIKRDLAALRQRGHGIPTRGAKA